MLRRSTILTVLLALLLGGGAAHAQNFQKAAKLFSAAQKAFSRGKFVPAAQSFSAAYGITKDPVLLYNVGEAWENARQPAKAVAAYRQYIAEQPKAADRLSVEKRVQALESKYHLPPPAPPSPALAVAPVVASAPARPVVAASPSAPTPPAPQAIVPFPPTNGTVSVPPTMPVKSPQPVIAAVVAVPPPATKLPSATATPTASSPPSPAAVEIAPPPPASTEPVKVSAPGLLDEDHPGGLRLAAWVTVAATVALITTGTIFGLAAQERSDDVSRRQIALDANMNPPAFDVAAQAQYTDLRDQGTLYNNVAIGLFAASAATAVTSAILFYADHRKAKAAKHVRILPSLSPRGGGLAAALEF